MAKKDVEKKKKKAKEVVASKKEEKEIKKTDLAETKKEEKVKKDKTKKVKKEGFFKSMVKEMKQVRWPSGKEMVRYVIATVVFVIVLALFFQLTDVITSFVKGLF